MRTYYGVLIHPMGRNTWGGRWEAYVGGRFHVADTLVGIKQTIREELGRGVRS